MKKFLSMVFVFALIMALVSYSAAKSNDTPAAAYITFGFRENDASTLRAKFNDAILSMKGDGTLTILQAKYLSSEYPEAPARFRNYNAADTIKIAITDSEASYFSTAVLAEISRRLRVNAEIISIRADEQIDALLSGKVDVILQRNPDEKGIALSEPYYVFERFANIEKNFSL